MRKEATMAMITEHIGRHDWRRPTPRRHPTLATRISVVVVWALLASVPLLALPILFS
jgi:hypothetical protein